MTASEAASEVERAAKEWENEGHNDPGLSHVYAADATQLREVATLIRDRHKGAYEQARRLDTIVREQIPDEVWDYMEEGLL